jgi:hypothetical protein
MSATAPDMSLMEKFSETVMVIAYRLAAYATEHLIDDAAMLAFIFS